MATRGETAIAQVIPHMRVTEFEAFDPKYNTPEFLAAAGVGSGEWVEAPSVIEIRDASGNLVKLPPMADFEKNDAPCLIAGSFKALLPLMFGGRSQSVWVLTLPDGLDVGIWGSTVLDRKMMAANPDAGAYTVIVYLGDEPTSKGLNPAKIFRVFVKK